MADSPKKHRAVALAVRILVSIVATLVFAETALRIASLFASDNAGAGWRPNAQIRVLAVGDSHTYGGTVQPDETYPAQLQRHLDDAAPGVYSVINIGIPGINTAQVRNRLPLNLARWEPDIVVFWCGVNNAWNSAESDAQTFTGWLDRLFLRLKVYKLARVLMHDRSLYVAAGEHLSGQRHKLETVNRTTQRVPFFGTVETRDAGEVHVDEESVRAAEDDYRAMRRIVESTGATPLFISYHLDFERFRLPNEALRRLAREERLDVVDGMAGLDRVPEAHGRFTWALHPSAPVYGEIARDVAARILSLSVRKEVSPTPEAAEASPNH